MAINQQTKTTPSLVIFDLFGTLIKFGEMHHPFRTLLKWARENGRPPHRDDARFLMTRNLSVKDLAYSMGIDAPKTLLQQIVDDIEVELNSLQLYDDVLISSPIKTSQLPSARTWQSPMVELLSYYLPIFHISAV